MVGACEGGADRRREQEGHSPGLALVPSAVPSADQALGVRHLSVGLGLPLSFHLSAVEAHAWIVAERACVSMRPLRRAGLGRQRTRDWIGEGRKVENCVASTTLIKKGNAPCRLTSAKR
jgi:hypothetical protein